MNDANADPDRPPGVGFLNVSPALGAVPRYSGKPGSRIFCHSISPNRRGNILV